MVGGLALLWHCFLSLLESDHPWVEICTEMSGSSQAIEVPRASPTSADSVTPSGGKQAAWAGNAMIL